MLLAWISIIIPRWLELSLDKWTCWVESVCMCVLGCLLVFKDELRMSSCWSESEKKKVIEMEISYSSGTVFLISRGCNWLRTPLPTRHQCDSCQSEAAGQPLVAPSPSFTINYILLDTHTNTCINTQTHACFLSSPSQMQTLSYTRTVSGEIITLD